MSHGKSPAQTLAKALGIAIVLAALTASGYVFFVKAPADLANQMKNGTFDAGHQAIGLVNHGWDTAKRIGKDLDRVINFRPKITAGGVTVVEQSKEIAEISLLQKSFDHTYPWEHTFLFSTKRLRLRGHFVAKAGYDLTKPYSVDVSEDGQSVRVTLPPARITSVEQTRIEVLQDENGIWNTITAEERQSALNTLLDEARRSLDRTTLLAEAEAALMTRLEAIVHQHAPQARIVRDPAPLP